MSIEVASEQALKVSRQHRYTLFAIAFWADREDYFYAPRLTGSDDLSELLTNVVGDMVAAHRLFVQTLRHEPMIVGAVVLRRSSGVERNRAACKHLSIAVMRSCILGERLVGSFFLPGSSLPYVVTRADGFDDAELAVWNRWAAWTVEETVGPEVSNELRDKLLEGNAVASS